MAQPSEPFLWKLFGITERLDPRKQCWECGKHPLRIEDVGEHRRRYPGSVDEFLCKECKQRQLDAAIDRTRAELGLSPRPTPS